MSSDEWFYKIEEWSDKYFDLQGLSHNEKLCLSSCLYSLESNREKKLNELANTLIYSPKINSNALRDAGLNLMDILKTEGV